MIESQLKDALIRFHSAIKNADGAAVSAALNEIEALFAAGRDGLHPQLAHFLAGRSFAKALAWLGGGDAAGEFGRPASPPGGCSKT